MKLSTVKIEFTEEELGLIREAIDNLREIEDRCDYGSCISDELYREVREIAQYLGQQIIRRMRITPF